MRVPRQQKKQAEKDRGKRGYHYTKRPDCFFYETFLVSSLLCNVLMDLFALYVYLLNKKYISHDNVLISAFRAKRGSFVYFIYD